MKVNTTVKLLTLLGLALALAPSAHAQATRTWVSGTGDDVNPGSRTAPCKTFAGAISKTAAGGEISVIDPAGYGAVTITKSMTIDGDDTHASILFSGTNGIVINAGPNDVVILRHLSFKSSNIVSSGLSGIRYIAGGQVIIEDCFISGASVDGVEVNLTASGNLVMRRTAITGGAAGLSVKGTTNPLNVTLEDVSIRGAFIGVDAHFGVTQATRCTFSQCANYGLIATGATITCLNSLLSSDGTAVLSQNGGTVRLSNDDIFDNATSMTILDTSKISTANNNRKAGNAAGMVPNAVITAF